MAKDLAEAAFSKSVAPLFHDFFAFVWQRWFAVVGPEPTNRLPPSNVRTDVDHGDFFFALSSRRRCIDGMEELVSARRRASALGCQKEGCCTAVCCTHFVSIYIARAADSRLVSTNNE